eukprot:1642676-Alexandrium_andersonii.AAC.2
MWARGKCLIALCMRTGNVSMLAQSIDLCVDPAKTLPGSHLRDGDFRHPKQHEIADVERHPPSGDHGDEEEVCLLYTSDAADDM